jgi:hypothetical protein
VLSPIAELLADIGRALDGLGVRWFLFGAQAAIIHGTSRLTADVDVTIDPGELNTTTLVQALQRERFALRVSDAEDFIARTRVIPLLHEATGIPCDAVLAGPGIEDLFFERVLIHDLGGVSVPVVAVDDLVAMKLLAGRDKDLEDVRAIVRAQAGALDVNRARATLELLERALDRRDLVPALDAILGRDRGV